MKPATTKAVVIFISLGLYIPAFAGPVAERLHSLGTSVPLPAKRPASPPEHAKTRPLAGQVSEAKPAPNTCLETLRTIAKAYSVPAPRAKYAACTIENPVRLQATLGKVPVSFDAEPILACNFALRLARFAKNTMQPLARHHLGDDLANIATGPGFTCRRRNNAATGKLSEHAFGKGIDIAAFSFANNHPLKVRAASDMPNNRAGFFQAVRTAACEHFTTVLGPGANAAHATHLHFDTGRMGKRKNPYRICQ